MITAYKLNELYNTISNDLKIEKFEEEDSNDFNKRLVYSAIGKWIMQLFADRDFEDNNLNQVSKMHVTISALNILSAYKKVDNNLLSYFTDDKKLINDIENIYLTIGYINSGTYTFKYPFFRRKVDFEKKTLVIDLDTTARKMRGLGLWGKQEEGDIDFSDFSFAKITALDYFKNILSKLNYIDFSSDYGKIEVYNIEKNRWDYFTEKAVTKFEYYILKIDDGLDYQILRNVDESLYVASLPSIYTKKTNDNNFIHEIWRIILGLCAYNGHPAKCHFSSYCVDGIKFILGGYILPFFDYSLLKCMSWPIGDANGINEFVTDRSMMPAIQQILNSLSIDIE